MIADHSSNRQMWVFGPVPQIEFAMKLREGAVQIDKVGIRARKSASVVWR